MAALPCAEVEPDGDQRVSPLAGAPLLWHGSAIHDGGSGILQLQAPPFCRGPVLKGSRSGLLWWLVPPSSGTDPPSTAADLTFGGRCPPTQVRI